MNNKDLDSILAEKFAPLREPPAEPSLVPDVMARVRVTEQATGLEQAAGLELQDADAAKHDWVLAFAGLLGALVCLPALSGFKVEALLAGLPVELLGGYAQMLTPLALPLMFVIAVLPLGYLLFDD